jgi:hypothetical protein
MPQGDKKLRALIRKSQAQASVSNGDIASGMFVLSSDYSNPQSSFPQTTTTSLGQALVQKNDEALPVNGE